MKIVCSLSFDMHKFLFVCCNDLKMRGPFRKKQWNQRWAERRVWMLSLCIVREVSKYERPLTTMVASKR
ncbi:hypothetical protein Y032_0014g2402 [Ancylostoma ceylanicum]|uniref:Uncharacterized protein n=1 Tax=Ancylostoma ceylanicum TaxID=53326 RepID=A0A016V9A5_9BILA|nr:hypothetical protein Y032_0014g2402 [Ancylostoma ceylanicum]